MPLPKPYPPEEIDYTHWEDLADNYAGKATTLIVDAGGKGDYSTIQEAVNAMPASNAGEILVRAGEYLLAKAVSIEDREDIVIRGMGKATRLRVAGKVQELVTADAGEGHRSVEVEDGSSFQPGQHVCVRDDSASEVNLVEAVDNDTLTMAEPLSHTYEVGDNVRVYTCHSAVHVTGESRRVKILNLSIDGNRLSQEFGRTGYYPAEHHGDGVRLSASTEDCVLEGCWIHSAAAHGVCVGGEGHRIAGNHCWDNGYDGVNVEPGCDRILVLGNHCFDQAMNLASSRGVPREGNLMPFKVTANEARGLALKAGLPPNPYCFREEISYYGSEEEAVLYGCEGKYVWLVRAWLTPPDSNPCEAEVAVVDPITGTVYRIYNERGFSIGSIKLLPV